MPLVLFASAANLATNEASAVSELGPKFRPTCSAIVFPRLAAWALASAKILSVSACASSMAASIPMVNCSGADAGAAGADDDDAAPVDGAVGANERGRPCGFGISWCVGGCPRVGGRERCIRCGPCVEGCGTTGGFTNVCP